ncbi:MAG: YceD family protein [Actinomycetota bacterium]
MRAIDVRHLLSHPGSVRTVRIDESVEGLHMELADVPEDSPVTGELLLESLVEGILVSGRLSGPMRMRCARCVTEFDREFEVEVSERFARDPDPEGDDYALDPDALLDPEPMVRDAVLLSMPFAPLCRPECEGLCERCGGDRNLGECTCLEPPADPRWAGLERLMSER